MPLCDGTHGHGDYRCDQVSTPGADRAEQVMQIVPAAAAPGQEIAVHYPPDFIRGAGYRMWQGRSTATTTPRLSASERRALEHHLVEAERLLRAGANDRP